MTIHSGHPFLPPEGERGAVRRLRGRLASGVTVLAAGREPDRAGLTVSSLVVADGDPAVVLVLVDEESALWPVLQRSGTAAMSLLGWEHRTVADVFAGTAPSPGGVFRTGTWSDGEWGPVLAGSLGWAGCRQVGEARPVGWSLLVELTVEHVELGADADPLLHHRGRYLRP